MGCLIIFWVKGKKQWGGGANSALPHQNKKLMVFGLGCSRNWVRRPGLLSSNQYKVQSVHYILSKINPLHTGSRYARCHFTVLSGSKCQNKQYVYKALAAFFYDFLILQYLIHWICFALIFFISNIYIYM